ncbi:MAG TPA: pyridoxamine 5'-phosphate oxidase family protein [Anaerolineae bacterium]|nr:pyridoxamine 5'-phosphate oxidase family protein [Anaerolineae bacterium]
MYEHVESGKLTPQQIDTYLNQPLLARMATASADTAQPHVVPVWYLWDGQSIWVHGYSGTRKFKELAGNPACSIVVDHATSGVDFWAVLFEGQVELITDPTVVHPMAARIYTRYIGAEGVLDPVPQSWIQDADSLLLKLTPSRIATWYSTRKSTDQA